MISLSLWYNIDKEDGIVATTPEELDAVRAFRGPTWPAVAQIVTTDDWYGQPHLHAGLHEVWGFLWFSGPGERNAWISRDPTRSDSSIVQFMYCENEFEVPSDAILPAPLIRLAVHEFAETGERPTCLLWQEWQPV
ncbi:Imm1 family immunity protein [Actinokineospora sp. G85]|uniref:Imm1 family immunity protein n=1 Tax=Actinokineospora sp. G85 TaxID=3406626 RepID=UPI003C710B59